MVKPRIRLLARPAKFVALAVFLLAWYVASPVFVGHWCSSVAPWAASMLTAVYSPLSAYYENPQLPGSRAYAEYIGWCLSAIENRSLSPTSSISLDARTNSEYVDVPLRDYVDMLAMQYPIALTPQVDGDRRVTLSTYASLRERLSEIERQCGVGWGWVNGWLMIGPPEAIQQLTANAEAEAKAKRFRGRIAMLISAAAPLLLLSGLVWQFRRRRFTDAA